MSPKTLDFQTMKEQAFAQMKAAKQCVLATADGNTVTARLVGTVVLHDKLYLFTGSTSRKIKQITANPKVAMVTNNLQIEGTARLCGHPSEPQNQDYLAALKESMEDLPPEIADVYLGLCADPNVPYVVVEVTPTRLQTYYLPPEVHLDVIDLTAGTARRYDAADSDWDYE